MTEASQSQSAIVTAEQLEQLFSQCFAVAFNTCLRGGADEPFYEAAREGQLAVIHYRFDYVSSALHEVAHWCIAGAQRRQQDDYGYWYAADGRDLMQQAQFEQVEVKPQALEQLFAEACGLPFRVSVDNLALPDYDARRFAEQVMRQSEAWRSGVMELPVRASLWIEVLKREGWEKIPPVEVRQAG